MSDSWQSGDGLDDWEDHFLLTDPWFCFWIDCFKRRRREGHVSMDGYNQLRRKLIMKHKGMRRGGTDVFEV